MKKRLILGLMTLTMLLSLALPVMAEETTEATEETVEETRREFSTEKEGECGDDLKWKLEGHTLTITGSGEMDDGCPWEFYKDTIERVIFQGEITTVGAGAFESCNNLEEIYFGDSLVEIGEKAFYSCNALEQILVPDSFRKFGAECFRDCENLDSVFCEGPMPSFKSSCMYNDHTVVVYFSQQTPWPWEEIDRLMSNFGGRVYAQMGSPEEWEAIYEDMDALKSEAPVAAEDEPEETVVQTEPETQAATEPVPTVPPLPVTETVPYAENAPETEPVAQVTEATEAMAAETQPSEPVELVFVEPERDMDTGETEPKSLEENIAEKMSGFNWGLVIAIFGGLVVLLILALIIRGFSHKGGKYSD